MIGYSDGSVHIRRIDSTENRIQLVWIFPFIFNNREQWVYWKEVEDGLIVEEFDVFVRVQLIMRESW